MSNLRPRWTGSYHTKEGFQVSKRKWKRGKGESERGSKKARGLRHNCVSTCIHVHIDCLSIECSDNHDRVYVHNNCQTADI
jgi:hypothetical protein